MADAFAHYGDSDTHETERFVTFMDRFFDMLNTRSLEEGSKKRKPDLDPYRTADDHRLKVYTYHYSIAELYHNFTQWLESDFLQYLKEWELCVACRPNFTAAEKKKMLLSDETRLGLKVTGIIKRVLAVTDSPH